MTTAVSTPTIRNKPSRRSASDWRALLRGAPLLARPSRTPCWAFYNAAIPSICTKALNGSEATPMYERLGKGSPRCFLST